MMERKLKEECAQIDIKDALPGDIYHMAFRTTATTYCASNRSWNYSLQTVDTA